MNPAEIRFAAQPKRVHRFDDEDEGCRGCLFERERSKVCFAACAEAIKRGLPDCDTGFIFVRVEVDPRQQDLFGEPA